MHGTEGIQRGETRGIAAARRGERGRGRERRGLKPFFLVFSLPSKNQNESTSRAESASVTYAESEEEGEARARETHPTLGELSWFSFSFVHPPRRAAWGPNDAVSGRGLHARGKMVSRSLAFREERMPETRARRSRSGGQQQRERRDSRRGRRRERAFNALLFEGSPAALSRNFDSWRDR